MARIRRAPVVEAAAVYCAAANFKDHMLAMARKLGIPVATDFHTNFHSYSEHYGIGWLQRPSRREAAR